MADQFAFIPREAISKFLLHCIECQRKNSMEHRNGGGGGGGGGRSKQQAGGGGSSVDAPEIIADSSTRDSSDAVAVAVVSGSGGVGGVGGDYRPLSPAPSLVEQ